jgi:putative two-component system response regulator
MTNLTGSVLVVDDNENNRELLTRRLKARGHSIVTVENGKQALEIVRQQTFDLMLLDIMMPEMNGFQVLEILKKDDDLRHLPVIVISGLDDMDSVAKCIELGAEDYLIKPFNGTLLKARIHASLEKKHLRDQEEIHRHQIEEYNLHLEGRVREQVKEVTASQLAIIYAMAKMAEFRDMETGRHLERVRDYCSLLIQQLIRTGQYAQALSPAYIDNILKASPLHDIGKVGVPDHILLKPGKLSAEEFTIMKTHTTIGADILRAVNEQYPGNAFIAVGMDIALYHHEKWDGSGYPHGLAGETIPLAGRILAMADVYDALRTKRVYKDAIPHDQACEIIHDGRSAHFDPVLVDCFMTRQIDFERIITQYKDD